jgi:SAM-dependent methyltransferase
MIADYYNQLAPYYKYMLQDWNASVTRQAAALDGVIREFFGAPAQRILDAACGIGTQSLGLAQLGYQVTASDISPAAIALAQAEAAQRGLQISFGIADMRQLLTSYDQPFDVVVACDNAVPHLLSDGDIRQAFDQFYQCTTASGGCIISVRDYANMERGSKKLQPRHAHKTSTGHLIVFDLWEFDGDYYDFTTYLIDDQGQPNANAQVIRGGRYYCVTLTKLEALLRDAGFRHVTILRERYYQPLLVGTKNHSRRPRDVQKHQDPL